MKWQRGNNGRVLGFDGENCKPVVVNCFLDEDVVRNLDHGFLHTMAGSNTFHAQTMAISDVLRGKDRQRAAKLENEIRQALRAGEVDLQTFKAISAVAKGFGQPLEVGLQGGGFEGLGKIGHDGDVEAGIGGAVRLPGAVPTGPRRKSRDCRWRPRDSHRLGESACLCFDEAFAAPGTAPVGWRWR